MTEKKEIIQFHRPNQVSECAKARQMYSMVKQNMRAVSRPNQTRLGVEWNGGRVSRMVIKAERTMRNVLKTCTVNAAVEDVGSSRR